MKLCSGGDGGGISGENYDDTFNGGGGGGTYAAADTFIIYPSALNTGTDDGYIVISYAG